MLQTLALLPSPEEVLALRPATALQERIEELLEKNRTGGLTSEDEKEWARYEYVECIIRLAKAGRCSARQRPDERWINCQANGLSGACSRL